MRTELEIIEEKKSDAVEVRDSIASVIALVKAKRSEAQGEILSPAKFVELMDQMSRNLQIFDPDSSPDGETQLDEVISDMEDRIAELQGTL